jgi:hypothetical protein
MEREKGRKCGFGGLDVDEEVDDLKYWENWEGGGETGDGKNIDS